MNEILIGLVFVSFFMGFYLREVLNALRSIINRLDVLNVAQSKDKKNEASFAEPMSRAEVAALIEEERINLLNR